MDVRQREVARMSVTGHRHGGGDYTMCFAHLLYSYLKTFMFAKIVLVVFYRNFWRVLSPFHNIRCFFLYCETEGIPYASLRARRTFGSPALATRPSCTNPSIWAGPHTVFFSPFMFSLYIFILCVFCFLFSIFVFKS